MKFILPLLVFSLNCIAQDTTWHWMQYSRTTDIYSFQNVYKSHKEDTLKLGAFMPIKRIGNTLYLNAPIGDTLQILSYIPALNKDTLMDMYLFNKTAEGFYEYGKEQPNSSITDHFFIYYNKIIIEDRKVPSRYWDYKKVSYTISVVRKQAAYSN